MSGGVLPMDACPHCDGPLDGWTTAPGEEDGQPEPGDCSVCRYCSRINTFDLNLRLRQPTEDELRRYARIYPRVSAAIQLTHEYQADQRRRAAQ